MQRSIKYKVEAFKNWFFRHLCEKLILYWKADFQIRRNNCSVSFIVREPNNGKEQQLPPRRDFTDEAGRLDEILEEAGYQREEET
ncbi:hypothetical protein MYX82_04310 [Acidobacteria bacterium AH-259-D05]|nr:hypothetical protein [Acidobacteria bacterium AH-259-D05]